MYLYVWMVVGIFRDRNSSQYLTDSVNELTTSTDLSITYNHTHTHTLTVM